jgi:hypothetical protein
MKHPHRSEAWMVLDELEKKLRRKAMRDDIPLRRQGLYVAMNEALVMKRTLARRENRRRKLEGK